MGEYKSQQMSETSGVYPLHSLSVIISQLLCIFAELREFVALPPTGWLQKLWCQTSSAAATKVSDTETPAEHLHFHSQGFNDHPKKPFHKVMQWVLMSGTGLLAMGELGPSSSSGMRGFEHLGSQNEGTAFPKMSVSKLNLIRISSSTRWF